MPPRDVVDGRAAPVRSDGALHFWAPLALPVLDAPERRSPPEQLARPPWHWRSQWRPTKSKVPMHL